MLLCDQVKAFDCVDRELLWAVLARLGMPDKIIRLVKALHQNVTVKLEMDGVEKGDHRQQDLGSSHH